MTFNTGNAKGTDHCIIGDIGKTIIKSHLIGCIEKSLVSIGVRQTKRPHIFTNI